MSSILRALKKLENETAAGQVRSGWRRPRYSYSRSDRTSSGLLLILLATVFLAAGATGGWWYFKNRAPASPDEHPVLQTTEPAAPGRPATLTPAPDTAGEPATGQLFTLDEAEPLSSPTPNRVAPETMAATAEPPAPELYNPPGQQAGQTAFEPDPPAHEMAELLPVLDNPALSLQAIAWSETPDKRVAVIGNRVSREGSMVAGFMVEKINPDDIIVRQQDVRWRIIFKNR